ncbi:MAG: hypothetical protein ACJ77A_14095 [Actinomycetota bacterium]
MKLPEFAPLDPGTYLIDPDLDPSTPLRVTYEVPSEGWAQWTGAVKWDDEAKRLDAVAITTVTNLVRDGCLDHSYAEPPVGPSVDDLATGLAALAPFRVASPPKDVTVYGYRGKHLELTVPDVPIDHEGFMGCIGGNLNSWAGALDAVHEDGESFGGYTGPGYREEFWILDVEGTRLVIAAERSPGLPSRDLAELQEILDSIRIEPPKAERIIADGALTSFAANESGTVLTVWEAETCTDWDVPDCGYAWRLGTGSQAQAAGMVGGAHGGYVVANAASGGGFVITPNREGGGFLIAPDGTASPLSRDCRDATWSTPTEPGRLSWATGYDFVDTAAGVICSTKRFGGRPIAPGVFTADGTLWALVDNEIGPDTLTIGRYDGERWSYHDFGAPSGAWTSVLAAAGSTVVVLLANPEPSPRPDQLGGLAVSTDAGATWSEVVDQDALARDLPFSTYHPADDESWFSGYTSMAFAGSSVLYVADGRGDLWRSTDLITFSQVEVAGGVSDLKPTGGAVIARIDAGGTCSEPAVCQFDQLVRISADGSVESITAR